MSGWIKLDEAFFLHPKALAAGRDGRDLYLVGLCWSNMQRTNGNIPAHALALIAGLAGVADPDHAADRLCDVGLWINTPEGWRIHDFLAYQQSKEERDAWLENERHRKAAARRKRAEAARNATETTNSGPVSAIVPRGQTADSAKVPRFVRSRDVDVDVDVDVEQISLSHAAHPLNNDITKAVENLRETKLSYPDNERTERTLRALAARLAQAPNVEKPAAYRRHLETKDPALRLTAQQLANEHPEIDPDELADMHLAARQPTPTTPRCGACHSEPHPNGIADCPAVDATYHLET